MKLACQIRRVVEVGQNKPSPVLNGVVLAASIGMRKLWMDLHSIAGKALHAICPSVLVFGFEFW